MKSTVKTFINTYGVNKVHYSIIVYGATVIRVVNFNKTFPISANELKAAIDKQGALMGGPFLEGALKEAFSVFNERMGRPGAKKVLVVITDKNSGASPSTLATAVRRLEEKGVLVISVGIGETVERSELKVISPNPMDVISARLNVNPSVLAERIMDRILRRNIPLVDVGFAISAASIKSDNIFALMKRIINTIIDRYGVLKVRFSVISYGSKVTTKFSFDNAKFTKEDLIRAVNSTDSVPGTPDLEKALKEAETLFKTTSRPNATKAFVVLTDVVARGNQNALIALAARLRKSGVLILSVGFGNEVDQIGKQMNKVVITRSDYIGIPNFITERPVVVAETIMFKALQANIPEIDLTFALSATSVFSNETFKLMTSTVNRIIQRYGITRIHYSVIIFGSTPTTHFDFSRTFPNKDVLVRVVSRLPKKSGRPDLAKALESVKKVYELRQVRPNAKKVVVVILDNESVNTAKELKENAAFIVDKGILAICVGVGSSIESKELQIITEEDRNIIQVKGNKNPDELAKEIMAIILRTSGYAQWGQWSTCSKTCRYLGVAGTRRRTRDCEIPELGCDGPAVEVKECNTEDCEGCQEKLSLNDTNYSTSASAIQPARFARLDTSNPGLSRRAWCADSRVAGSYVQIDLGERVEVYQIATKGQEESRPSWVTRYFLSISEDGSSFLNYTQGGQTKVFSGNTDSSSVVFNKLNATTPVRYVRFYPISFNERPCMQASVFGCSSVIISPTQTAVAGDDDAGQGILIALWILAGILTFLLLLACLYYCCWHVCCNRGKKRKGLAAFKDTSSEDGYLIEEDGNKAWRGPAAAMAPTVARVKTPEDEVQEVSIEMTDDVKPLGVIQFGIETEETKDKHVTADEVHSETPKYSQEVGQIKSGAEMLTMSSTDTGYRSTERRRHKSETAASIADAGATSAEWSYRTEQRQSSAFDNGAYMRSQEFVAEQTGPSQTRVQGQELKRSKSADELSTSNYAMFEQRRGSSQQVVRGEMGRDGYMRMKETRQGSVDVTDGGIQMGTIDVAIGGIGTPDTRRGSSQLYGMEEQEMSFSADNGGRNVYYLDDGGYRTEEWYTRGGRGPGQLRNEGFREIHVEHQPIYTEIQPDSERFRHSRII